MRRHVAGSDMNRVLVTGATGFVGRPVVAALAAGGYSVRAAARRALPQDFPRGVEVVRQPDMTEPVDWQPLLDGVDKVVHLAGTNYSGHGVEAKLYDRVNREATADLAAAAARAGIQQLIYMSSVRAQCGASADHAVTERDPPAPTDAHGRSKLAAEEAVRSSGVPFTILRPVLIYGPGMTGSFALLLRAAASPLPMPVKNLVARRSLLGIDNFISALELVLSSPAAIGETYLVADPGIPPKLSDIVATLREARGYRSIILPMSTDYVELALRMIGRRDVWERFGGNLRIDPTKLMAAGWRPLHDTRAGLTAMIKSPRAQSGGEATARV